MRAWIIPVWLALLPIYSLAGDNPASQQLLDDAAKLIRIQGQNKTPFVMDVDFQAQINVPRQGHITWMWAGNERWYWNLTMGDYREIQVRKGEMVYTKRNAPFTPLPLRHLQSLLEVFHIDSKNWEARKTKVGSGLLCVQMKQRRSNVNEEICLRPDNKQVASIEFKGNENGNKQVFADYQPFRDNVYPRELKYFEDGSLSLNLKVISLQETSLEDSVFTPPENSIVRRKCENLAHAIPIKQPDPEYPPSARQNHISGTTVVALTVEDDGSVNDVQIIRSAEHEMDQRTVETVKTWKFKPAMCGNDPVTTDITVEVNFRLSQ